MCWVSAIQWMTYCYDEAIVSTNIWWKDFPFLHLLAYNNACIGLVAEIIFVIGYICIDILMAIIVQGNIF